MHENPQNGTIVTAKSNMGRTICKKGCFPRNVVLSIIIYSICIYIGRHIFFVDIFRFRSVRLIYRRFLERQAKRCQRSSPNM